MPRPQIHENAAARQRAYRERKATGEAPLGTVIDGDTPHDVLTGISRDPRAPASSRVQAARALQEHEGRRGSGERAAEFVAMRAVLETLPVADRLAYLRERLGKGPIPEEGEEPQVVEVPADAWLDDPEDILPT